MLGTIRVKGKCPSCGEPFVEIRKVGFVCPDCKTVPERVYIDLPHDGSRVRIYSDKTGQVLDTYTRAKNLRETINTEIQNHSFDPSKYIKADQEQYWTSNLLDRFLKYRTKEIAPSYQKDYRRMTSMCRGFFKIKDVREIRKIDLLNFKDHCEETKPKWSPKTLKNMMDFLKAFLRFVCDELEMTDHVPLFPRIDVQEPKFRWMGAKDQITLFEKVPDEDKPIIAFLMLHGCRPGEARALKCKDVNLETNDITICATFSLNVYREKRKGRRSKTVTIPIHPEMLDYITSRVKSSLPEAFLFSNPRTGGFYSHNSVWRLWDKVRDAAEIDKGFRLYDASRHSFASQLINSGTSLFTVSKLLGHSSTKMTEKYAHHHIDSLRVELSKITLTGQATVSRLSPGENSVKIS